jgi:flagellar protein FlaJ
MSYATFVRSLVKKYSFLSLKLKKAGSPLTPFQYIHQTISMTIMSLIVLMVITFLFFKSSGFFTTLLVELVLVIFGIPLLFKFYLGYVDVQIQKYGRLLESDLLFISEYILVTLESGLPLGNIIQRLSEIDRPGGRFFKRIYLNFKTGKDLDSALKEAVIYSPNDNVKILVKKLTDSLTIGVDLREVLSNFIEEASEKKIIEIKSYTKKLNPLIMMYLLLGIVVPSLGITFLILGIAVVSPGTPQLLQLILIFVFLFMFTFQYFAYTSFKFSKATL